MENLYLISKKVLQSLDVPFSKNYLKDMLNSHPEPDTLLALSDTLNHYKVNNLALQLTEEKLEEIPLPSILQVREGSYPYFSVLTGRVDNSVSFLDEKGSNKTLSKSEFVKNWTGITLLMEKSNASGEPGYSERRKEHLIFRGMLFLFCLIGAIWLTGTLWEFTGSTTYTIGVFLFFILKIAGTIISAILLWSEVDKDNRAIKDFCTGGKNTDCNSVTSSFSLPGGISLSIIAFAYFISGVLVLLLTSFSRSGLQLLGYLSLSGIFIIPISIYYQWAKIRKWCLLCLWISALLTAEILLSQIFLVNSDSVQFQELALYSFLFIGIIVAWLSLKPYFLTDKELQKQKSKLTRFLSNTEIFDHFLSGSRRISNNPEGLGILLKGQNPKFHVVKVCNPYCDPCAKTHPVLEELFASGNIDLQVIFHPGGDDAIKRKTISHIMAVVAQGNQEETIKALDDWYFPDKREYESFAAKYPMNGEMKAQENKIESMQKWCEQENIIYTPTIFINGMELPKAYSVEDLKYILV